MPTKAELYAQMAEKVATQLTGSWQEWAGFLTTAARLYKYPFHEQLMIYAQRPDATACAEYDLWNEKMGRYVRRGSKGIALVDDSGDRPRLRYVFDISDTGTREHSRTPWLWQLEERHLDSVQAMLERTYDVSGDDLAGQLTEVAGKLAEEYWTEHQQDFFYGEPLEQLPNGYSDHYVPDGFERDREQEFERAENFLHVYSSKESGEGYTVRCSIIQPGQQSSFDNEHTTYKNVKVGDADATLGTSVGESGDTVYILSWEQGGVSNTIMGNISRDEIVRIAENIF